MDFAKYKLVKLTEADEELVLLKNLFYLNSSNLAKFCLVVGIHCIKQLNATKDDCLEALFHFSNGIQGKGNNLGDFYYHWHGTYKAELSRILDIISNPGEHEKFGFGSILYLSHDPETCAIDSIVRSTPDEYGLRYLLFCRIIGKEDPNQKFMTWNLFRDEHIQPVYVVTLRPIAKVEDLLRRTPWPMSRVTKWPQIIAALSERVPLEMSYHVRKAFNDYMELKFAEKDMYYRMVEIAGKEALDQIVAEMKKKKQMSCLSQSEEIAGPSQKRKHGDS